MLLFGLARHYYTELNAAKLDPLDLRRFGVPAPQDELTLVFYGDSRAAQWPAPSWLEGQTLNLGIAGQTTEQILERFDHHLAGLHPKFVLLQAGINDLKTIPLFPDNEQKIIDNCKDNLGQLVERSRQLGAHVVITTIFPLGRVPLARRLIWSDRVAPAVASVNRYIESLASDHVTVMDSGDVLADTTGIIHARYSRDFLHLSAEGYRQLDNSLHACLQPLISGLTR